MESALEYCRRVRSESVNRYQRDVTLTADDCNILSHALQMYLIDLEGELEWDAVNDAVDPHAAEELRDVKRLREHFKELAQPTH